MGSMGKYVQDQEGAIDDLEVQFALQLLLDMRTQLVVEYDHTGAGVLAYAYQLGKLALADVVSGVWFAQLLADACHCLDSHAGSQLLELVQGSIDVELRVRSLNAHEDGRLYRVARGLRATVLLLSVWFGLNFVLPE